MIVGKFADKNGRHHIQHNEIELNDTLQKRYEKVTLSIRIFNAYAKRHYAEYHYAECYYAKCHYAECHYAECCGAQFCQQIYPEYLTKYYANANVFFGAKHISLLHSLCKLQPKKFYKFGIWAFQIEL